MTQPRLKEFVNRTGLSQSGFSRTYRISQPYLNQIMRGTRKAGKKTAEYLENISDGYVRKQELRPDLWG
jgi:DNA-binding transcriptional regulator YdaS (Cro superfamily)